MLSWVERNLAATLFANPPTSTVDEALKEFLEVGQNKEELGKELIDVCVS